MSDRLRVWAVVCSDGKVHKKRETRALAVSNYNDLDGTRKGLDQYCPCGPHRVAELVEVDR